jgi:cellulose synthase/poly-beta-1,6-N-acetylglucosamine synthase-like glycosyltransferase
MLLNIILIISALYLIFIIAFTFGLYNLKEVFFTFKNKNNVKVSVLIAARNEGKNIDKLLQSLYNQSFSKELFEVIIIDDHSEDNTKLIIEDFIKEHKDFNLKIFNAEKEGKKLAISQALHLSKNEFIIVTDADCSLNETWIESIVNFYKEKGCKMILAPVLLSPAETFFEKIQVLEHLSLIGSTAGSAAIGFPVMCNGANMAYEKEAALEIEKKRKDFNIPSGDDMFLMEQWNSRAKKAKTLEQLL